LENEPLVQKSIQAGASVVCFSGDKLIGGPQSGILVGKADIMAKIKKNPLKRAFRCGKMTIAALEATLKLFLNQDKLNERHPVYRMLSLTPENLMKRARQLERRLKQRLSEGNSVRVQDGGSEVGSGSVPAQTLPTKLVSVKSRRFSADELAKKLRLNRPPVFTRILKDEIVFDLRTIRPGEDAAVEEALIRILNQP
jgi:L-seryl-tRNA(Ser) seleniumtransferase